MNYTVMNRPCSITTDDKLWCISGVSKTHGSGVLAWCYDQADAEYWYDQMKGDADFSALIYHKFTENK